LQNTVESRIENVTNIFNSTPNTTTLLSKQYLENQRLMKNSTMVNSVIEKLKNRVGKTWYVFSGNTPSGWDCSGLTMWFYQQLGIELEHRSCCL
jgi:cell wall-associated NlpC family hydrolase